MSDVPLMKKLPASIQALLGFALTIAGVKVMLDATGIAALAEANMVLVIQYLFFLIGILYLLNGIPSLIEGVMTMNAEYERRKIIEPDITKRVK